MGNSTSSGQGGDVAHSIQDMVIPESSERPTEVTKHETSEVETQSMPQDHCLLWIALAATLVYPTVDSGLSITDTTLQYNITRAA